MESNKSSSWEMFGKVSAVLTALATVIGIYIVVFPTSEDVNVSVRYSEYALAPDIKQSISNVMVYSNDNKISELIEGLEKDKRVSLSYDERVEISEAIADALSDGWTEKFKHELHVDGYKNYFSIEIVNDGDLAAKEVVLDLPISGLASFQNQAGDEVALEFKKTIKVGDIRPNNTVNISVWSGGYFSDYNRGDGFHLSHESGVGEIEFVLDAEGIDLFVIDNKGSILFLFLLFLGFFLLSLSQKESKPENSEDDQSDEKEI